VSYTDTLHWWNEDVIRYSKSDQRNFDLRAVFIFSDRAWRRGSKRVFTRASNLHSGIHRRGIKKTRGVGSNHVPFSLGKKAELRRAHGPSSGACESGLAGKLSSIVRARSDPSRSPPLHRSEQRNLFLRCVIKLFVRVHHVLMGLLDGVEFLLLLRVSRAGFATVVLSITAFTFCIAS